MTIVSASISLYIPNITYLMGTKSPKSLNKNLRKAKTAKNDEFYTQLTDIEKELGHYKDYFKDKVIFCNCDDPEESNFWQYFSLNFEYLGLKKLISTHYAKDSISYKLERVSLNEEPIKTLLEGDGDFRSPECIEILKEADIVVTNPPFSLFREYVAQLIEYEKRFLIIGNQNAITYKDIFKLIKDGKLWLGNSSNKTLKFRVPDYYTSINGFVNVPAISWFTNLEHNKRNEHISLYKAYKGYEDEYPKYDNYDAINVDKVKEIPIDYEGSIGVPITFLDKYNPEQFEIVGQGRQDLCDGMKCMSENFVSDYYKGGGTGLYRSGNPLLGYYKNGKAIIPYMRIIIKHKKLTFN